MSTGTNAKRIKIYKRMARPVTPGKNKEEMEELENWNFSRCWPRGRVRGPARCWSAPSRSPERVHVVGFDTGAGKELRWWCRYNKGMWAIYLQTLYNALRRIFRLLRDNYFYLRIFRLCVSILFMLMHVSSDFYVIYCASSEMLRILIDFYLAFTTILYMF